MSLIIVITTLPEQQIANRIACLLVEKGLVACAQMETINSVYRWEGALRQDTEIRLSLKASAENYCAIRAEILALHPYDLPAIHAICLDAVYEPYAAWIHSQCKPGGGAI